jgi:hypothetical protein
VPLARHPFTSLPWLREAAVGAADELGSTWIGGCGILWLAINQELSRSLKEETSMEVYGFQLPASFEQLRRDICERKLDSIWVQKGHVDAYGLPWEVPDLTITRDTEKIRSDTDFLRRCFGQGGFHQNESARDKPGFITDFTDVSKLIWFGRTGSGDPYCFDFGTNLEEPSVVCWDYHWRRVAPSFTSFIALFLPSSEAEAFDPSEEE